MWIGYSSWELDPATFWDSTDLHPLLHKLLQILNLPLYLELLCRCPTPEELLPWSTRVTVAVPTDLVLNYWQDLQTVAYFEAARGRPLSPCNSHQWGFCPRIESDMGHSNWRGRWVYSNDYSLSYEKNKSHRHSYSNEYKHSHGYSHSLQQDPDVTETRATGPKAVCFQFSQSVNPRLTTNCCVFFKSK